MDFRQALLERKRYLETVIEDLQAGLLLGEKDSAGELSAYDNHPAEASSNLYEREKDVGQIERARARLRQVNQAIERWDEGTYGYCLRCRAPIAAARLEAVPEAAYCLSCQEEVDALSPMPDRPAEEDVLAPPFGRSSTGDTGQVEYDGEDAWQDVARYGSSNTPADIPGARRYDETLIEGNRPLSMTVIEPGGREETTEVRAGENAGAVEGIDTLPREGPAVSEGSETEPQ